MTKVAPAQVFPRRHSPGRRLCEGLTSAGERLVPRTLQPHRGGAAEARHLPNEVTPAQGSPRPVCAGMQDFDWGDVHG